MSDGISGTVNGSTINGRTLNTEIAHSGVGHSFEHESHAGVSSYVIGFVMSVVLTAAPFWAVMTATLPRTATLAVVVATAFMQIVVHLKYFLHLDFSQEGKMNTFAFLFTALIIVMVVGLSIWIIYSANALMM